MRVDLRPVLLGIERVEDTKANAVDPPLVEGDAARVPSDKPRLDAQELRGVEAGVELRVLEGLVVVVGAKVGVDELEQDAAFFALRDGHQERDPKQEERRDLLDVARVTARRFRHAGVRLEVADAAVNHPARVAARAERQIVPFEEDDAQIAQREIARNARPVDASADHSHIEALSHPPAYLPD